LSSHAVKGKSRIRADHTTHHHRSTGNFEPSGASLQRERERGKEGDRERDRERERGRERGKEESKRFAQQAAATSAGGEPMLKFCWLEVGRRLESMRPRRQGKRHDAKS